MSQQQQQQQQQQAPQDTDRLLEPYRHVCSLKSKNFRNTLIDAFTSGWIRLPAAAIAAVTSVVEMLHNASLMVDDIEDSSALRRGAPAAHRVFGVAITLNSANLVYFLALQQVLAIPQSLVEVHRYYKDEQHRLTDQLSQCFAEELIALHQGQGLDILWREELRCPTQDQYEQMVQQKTGGLFRLALRMLLILEVPPPVTEQQSSVVDRNAKKEALVSLVNMIAVYFQTMDDVLNVSSSDYALNKSFCEDITEGKFSAPVLHCVRSQERNGNTAMLHVLRQRTTDVDLKKHCVEMMRKEGSLEHCEQRMAELKGQIEDHARAVNALIGDHGAKFLKCMEYLSSLS